MSFEYLSDKRANFIFASLAIPDVFGIDTRHVWYLPSSGKIIVLGLVHREFRQGSGVPTSCTLTDLEGSLSWSYRMCPVFIPDVSGMHDQRPTTSFQKP